MKKIEMKKIRTWFVTGASSGLGFELCRKLLERGYRVIAAARHIPQFDHENALCVAVDVRDTESISTAMRQGIARFGSIEVLCNNAGISSYNLFEEESPETMRNVMETNFWGAVNTMRFFVPYFREQGVGTIVNISSECGLSLRAHGAAYCSSKYALEGLSSVVWQECGNFCRVITVELAYFEGTNIGKDAATLCHNIPEYRDIPWFPYRVRCQRHNDLSVACPFIVDEVEKLTPQRRLMLGTGIVEKIEQECGYILRDLKASRHRANQCGSRTPTLKHYGRECESKCSKKNVAILNFHWENVNYGAVLTAYALNRCLRNLGYNAQNVDYHPLFRHTHKNENVKFDRFRKNHLPMTPTYMCGSDLSALNNDFDSFIVGSDQVWRHEFVRNDKDAYFLSFAAPEKKRISYAASFGTEDFVVPRDDKCEYQTLLASFDHVSTRERSGVDICKGMGVDAALVLDPVFLLSREHWDSLSREEACTTLPGETSFYSVWKHLEPDIRSFIDANSDILRPKAVTDISRHFSIPNWLAKVRDCQFLITDSFHGTCFALIFHKQFVCINPHKSTSTRMLSLLNTLGVENRFYSSPKDVPLADLLSHPIDYQRVDDILTAQVAASMRFLCHAMEDNDRHVDKKRKTQEIYNGLLYNRARRHRWSAYWQFCRCSFLASITLGKRREKYKQKKKLYHALSRKMKADMRRVHQLLRSVPNKLNA